MLSDGAAVTVLMWVYRNMGKKLFMDEDRLQVPFLAGSMTDDAFISASNPAATPTGKVLSLHSVVPCLCCHGFLLALYNCLLRLMAHHTSKLCTMQPYT